MKKTIGIIALALFVGASLTYACGCGCKDKKAKASSSISSGCSSCSGCSAKAERKAELEDVLLKQKIMLWFLSVKIRII